MRISLHVTTKDRHTETALLLQSLRTQTYQDWDLVIHDDASGMPLFQAHFISSLIARLKLEGHAVVQLRSNMSKGVCNGRNMCIKHDNLGNPLTCRLDDDVLLEPDYLEKLVEAINQGYDLVSGVIPLLMMPEHVRETKHLGSVINLHRFDEEGNLVEFRDECAYCYDKDIILSTHQFRTHALYRSELHKVFSYPENLSMSGFREEGFVSLKLLSEGKKLAVRTGAVAYHLQTPSGGCRSPTYDENVQLDHASWLKFAKKLYGEKGDFLEVKQ